MAGYCAEIKGMRIRGVLGGGQDWDRALQLVGVLDDCIGADAEWCIRTCYLPATKRLLSRSSIWKAISELAAEAYERRSVVSKEIERIAKYHGVGKGAARGYRWGAGA